MEETKTDIIVQGEGEIASARILNGENLDSIPGVMHKDNHGNVCQNKQRSEQLSNINEIPRNPLFYNSLKINRTDNLIEFDL